MEKKMKQISSIKRISEYKSIYIPDVILEEMQMDAGDNVVWFQNDDGQYLIKKVNVDIVE
jgi:bifunctional DNA-binding transcriptional regulator/antitoxin component of YhaV-PrlF toxin-antitoxin module